MAKSNGSMMTTIKAVANKGEKIQRAISFEYSLPTTLPEMVKAWGEGIVASMAQDTFVIRLQARARGLLTLNGADRMNDVAIIKDLVAYKPGVGRKAADPAKRRAAIVSAYGRMSDAEKATLRKMLSSS